MISPNQINGNYWSDAQSFVTSALSLWSPPPSGSVIKDPRFLEADMEPTYRLKDPFMEGSPSIRTSPFNLHSKPGETKHGILQHFTLLPASNPKIHPCLRHPFLTSGVVSQWQRSAQDAAAMRNHLVRWQRKFSTGGSWDARWLPEKHHGNGACGKQAATSWWIMPIKGWWGVYCCLKWQLIGRICIESRQGAA